MAQKSSGEWLELGSLTEGYNEFVLDEPTNIVTVKLQWTADIGRPEIFEIKPTFVGVAAEEGEIPEVPEEPGDDVKPETPEEPEKPEDDKKPETPVKPGNPSQDTEKSNGKLPNTGAPVGAGAVAAIGGALAILGTAIFKKNKK